MLIISCVQTFSWICKGPLPQLRLLNVNRSKQIKIWECLLLFGAESFVFQFAIQIFKGQGI
jgi:hypothetical protein